MSDQALLISVRLLDNRYHGNGSWPPSPFRLYQALVAAAYTGSDATAEEISALLWLEQLAPPIVLSPIHKQSTLTTYYVPRNGADAQQGDLAAAAKKRDAKLVKPWLLDAQQPLQYVWFFDEPKPEAQTLAQLSERLYQLGRGVDMAFAWAEQLTANQARQIIFQHTGPVFRPTPQGVSNTLDCPNPKKSFESLVARYQGQLKRLRKGEFHKPPLPVFQPTGYNCSSSLLLFDIRDHNDNFAAQPFTQASLLTQRLIERAKQRLLPHFSAQAERYLAGKGANDADKALRIRVIPLPSFGHPHTQPDIRRVLVEVPTDCPLKLVDVEWAFSGPLEFDLETGEIDANTPILIKATDRKMLTYYGIGEQKAAHVWRTMTPVALPLDPKKQLPIDCDLEHNKSGVSGAQRRYKQSQLFHAASQALRHSGITAQVQIRRIQREPFDRNGTLAERFAFQRFDRTRLYHLELEFAEPFSGPLVIGNGRFQGLGLMRPADEAPQSLLQFQICPDNQPAAQDRPAFVQAVRRAVMSLARQTLGQANRLFSGHEADGSTARSGRHEHIFIATDDRNNDGLLNRLLVIAPWHVDRNLKPTSKEQRDFQS
ncbi:MAG: type I-U CRISPR-associated protein Cas5/Cas6, partial [Methylomonas sp.]